MNGEVNIVPDSGILSGALTKNKLILIAGAVVLALAFAIYVLLFLGSAGPSFYTLPEFSNDAGFPAALPSNGEVLFKEGILEQGVLPRVMLLGRVKSAPVTDPETGEVSFVTTFTGEGGDVDADVVLGTAEDNIVVTFTEDGFINPESIVLEGRPIPEVSQLILEGDPVYVELGYIPRFPEQLLNDIRCDRSCREKVSEMVLSYADTSSLIRSVREGTAVDTDLSVGLATYLILHNSGS